MVVNFISLAYPQALILGMALAWLYTRRLRRRNLWRGALLALAIILICYPSIVHTTRAFDLYVLADRSRSISEEGRAKEMELLGLASSRLQPGDRLAVVSFNEKAYVEQVADSQATIKSFGIPYSEDASDLTEGLQLALSQADGRRPARVLLLSDGEYTGQDPRPEALVARQRGIPIYTRNLRRTELFNLSVRDADIPDQLLAGEPCRIAFKVIATADAEARYRIRRDGRIVGREKNEGWRPTTLKTGENTIAFSDTPPAAGIHAYKLEVESTPASRETMLSDNYAERYVKVVGERPILVVNNSGAADNVTRVLTAGGLQTHVAAIGNYRLGIGQLTGYKGVILNNVPVLGLSVTQLEDLRRFVEEEGGGLLVCGGNRSFSSGGYYKTALEPVLPVSLEDRQQSKKVSTAFSIVMDRSGSMAMRTPSGHTKISLANSAVVECLGLMSPVDSVSVIAVDSMAHVMVEQQDVNNPAAIIDDVRRIDSMGGGIFVYTGLRAAADEIMKAKQLNKHILLFADAADSEEPGEYKRLLAELTAAGVTVSVVGLGSETDVDAAFLKDVAALGKGTIYFTQDAAQLVQFFTADTITYTRNSFVEDAAPMQVKAAARAISPDQPWRDFTCAGYNLLFTKPQADVALMTADEDKSPALAFWQRGLGRVATLALDAEGAFAGQGQYGDIMLSAARWMMGSNVEDNMQIRVAYEGSYARVTLEVSEEERERLGATTVQIFTPKGGSIARPLAWDAHNRLSAYIKLTEPGLYRGAVQIGGSTHRLPPMSVPVSPEFIHDREPDFGSQTLAQLAALTGGREILDVRDVFDRASRAAVTAPVLRPFLIAFLVLLLLEIAEPRFGLLAMMRRFFESQWAALRRLGRRWAPAGGGIGSAQATRTAGAARATTGRPAGRPLPHQRGEGAGRLESQPETAGATENAPARPETPAPQPDMDYLAKSKLQSRRNLRLKGDRDEEK